MLYLLDASVIITAHDNYYEPKRVPEFWEWIVYVSDAGHAKMPREIYDEIAISTGPLGKWIKDEYVKNSIILDEEVSLDVVSKIIELGYAPDLTDDEVEQIGRDPFLVAYADQGEDRVVVTCETSKPSWTRAKRKLPDVCDDIGVRSITDFEFYRTLDFRTSWNK